MVVSLFQSRLWDLQRAPSPVPANEALRWGGTSLPGKGVAEPTRPNCDSSVTLDRPPFSDLLPEGQATLFADRQG